ncbi:MAG: hypothetical protein OXI39_02215 [Gemmatimonadota bacterium]|uniref:hypothetical protein n=1 Tax=Candidatus Palauibacter scopulicola TaxID=3056741 RepID=UPI002390F94F|nr:hypothetical protein [Candidatus Palauibacter scopulicola]MDE2661804.1 hypothetical protein [Candidatus Palauibacter scopulicola]
MPDLEGALPLILLMIFLWVRSIGAAMKKNRQRQEQALEQAGAAPEFEAEPSLVRAAEPAGVEAPPPARRPTLREQLQEMGRQLEQQMQQAADEGRPGSMVGHRDPEEAPEPPPFIRPAPAPAPRPVASAPAPAPPVRERPRRPPPGRPAASALREPHGPATASRRASTRHGGPLERLERYPSLARAVILSEILGRPPGLSDDRNV